MRSTKRTSVRAAVAVCAVIGAISGFGTTGAVAATPAPTATNVPTSTPTASAKGAAPAPSADPTTDRAGDASAAPPDGHWVALDPVTATTPAVPTHVLTKGSCPSGTTNYSGSKHPYSCLAVFLDGSHHQVGLRIGRSGSETSAFGYLHALQDHNVEEQTIEHAVQINAAGVLQPNNRRLYGAEFIAKGKATEEFVAFEERAPSSASPDKYDLGIVTAYCTAAPSGPISRCPDWVNDSL